MLPSVEELLPGFYCFSDTCQVYVWAGESESLAIDFGSGAWVPRMAELSLPPLRHVLLTHHHADQAAGLIGGVEGVQVHASEDERPYLEPAAVAEWQARAKGGFGAIPFMYGVLEQGLEGVAYDLSWYHDFFWGERRIRCLQTPGHGLGALSMVLTVERQQVVCCGDAAHAGAVLWQPYHLEWDHWTGRGALAAWEGVEKLANLGMDLLCPSHGPVIGNEPQQMLRELSDKLLRFYRAKGSICAGEVDRYLEVPRLGCGAHQLSAHVYQFGENGYLLRDEQGHGLVVDPFVQDLPELEALLAELDTVRVTDVVATHYHIDHCDGMLPLKEQCGARVWLHPVVAEPLEEGWPISCPWLPPEPVTADELLPAEGSWNWREHAFRVAHFPGQTWWHCALMCVVDGQQVLFGGDSFQPPSRWSGTGGFCSWNGCRFGDGFARSAQLVLDWEPDVLACGHGTFYRFAPGHFEAIKRWSAEAESATRALCIGGDLRGQYYLHSH